jgi:signal transduction histidine kinase/CheY-like chemotaxis protein
VAESSLETGNQAQLEATLRRHRAFSDVLAEGARRLIAPAESLDEAIDAHLGSLAAFAGADRCYLFAYNADSDTMTNTNEWCGPQIPPQIHELEALPVSELPWFWRKLLEDQVVHVPRVADLGAEAHLERDIFESGGIQSLLCVLITLRGEPVGFLGFDSVARPRGWSEVEVELLRRSTALFAGVVERRNLERERQELHERLVHSSKLEAVGRLAGGVAHDFNNLLTVITGNLSLALHPRSQLREELREDLETAREAALHAGELTRQLLSFGRRQVLRPETVSLSSEVRELLPLLRRLLREDVRLELDLDEDLPPICVDPALLPQILLNMIGNAGDAIEGAGRILIKTRPHPREGEETWVSLTVSDTGPGLTPESRERLFEPFYTTKGPGGTGLGLATVYGAVRQHGGQIEVESEPGQGTLLRVLLPPDPEPAPPAVCAPAVRSCPVTDWTGVALVVEDDIRLRDLLGRFLREAGWETVLASNGQEALGLGSEVLERVELLVSDVVMPRVGGPDLYRGLEKLRGVVPTVFVSGYAGTELKDPELRSAAFLQKPFTPERLLASVASVRPTGD